MAPWTKVAVVAGIAVVAAGTWWVRHPVPDVPESLSAGRDAPARRSPFAPLDSPGSPSAVGPQTQSSVRDPNANSVARMRELSADFSRRQDVYAKAARADRGELDSLIAAAKRSPAWESRRGDLEVLLLRYAEIDPEAALHIAMDMDRDTAMHLVRMLAASDPEQTWQRVSQVGDPLSRASLQSAVISAWVTQEPKRAFAQVAGLSPGWERNELLKDVTADVARRDPLLAIELIKGVEADKAGGLSALVAGEWARFDPSAAARWIESVEPGKQTALVYAIASAYVEQKPDEALAWALRIARSPSRNLWSSMLGEMATRDAEGALRLALGGETSAQRTNGAASVLSTLALRDQALAMSYLQKLPAPMRRQVFQSVAWHVASTSFERGLEWLERTDDRRARASGVMQMANNLAFRDVEAAATFVDRVPREVRGQWIANVARAYVNVDIAKAQEWVRKYEGEVKHLNTNFVQALAKRNPAAALELADGVMDAKERDGLLVSALPVVAQEDAESAAQWTERIRDDRQRAEVVSAVARTWADYDQPAARKWLMSMGEGEPRDRGFSAIANQAESVDDIMDVVRQIRAPDLRMQTVLYTAIRLKVQDPDAARALLRRQPLDPSRQAQYDRSDGSAYMWRYQD